MTQLDDNSKFGVLALSAAINKISPVPSQIRDLGIFKPKYLSTTHVDIEYQETTQQLIQSRKRGEVAGGVDSPERKMHTFKITHLPVYDTIVADEVQNIRAFGTTQLQAVENKVIEKLATQKASLEMTREHHMLGALGGKILDANNKVILDIYDAFGLKRETISWKFSDEKQSIGAEIDKSLTAMRKKLKGAAVTRWVAFCGDTFLEKLKYHKSLKDIYSRYQEGAAYRNGNAGINPITFEFNGIQFIQYNNDFSGSEAAIHSEQAFLLPVGTNLYSEFFAPADFNETVNTTALPYYAKRKPLDFDKGYQLHSQTNPLPMLHRPDLVVTLTAA